MITTWIVRSVCTELYFQIERTKVVAVYRLEGCDVFPVVPNHLLVNDVTLEQESAFREYCGSSLRGN